MESRKKSTQHNNTATYLRLICTGVMLLLLLLLLIWFDATTTRRVSTTLWTKWIWEREKKQSICYTGRSVGRSADCLLARTRDHDLRCRSHIYLFVVCCYFFFLRFVLGTHTHRSTSWERERNTDNQSLWMECVRGYEWISECVCVCAS